MYSNYRGQIPSNYYPNQYSMNQEDERFLLAPFLFGGLAGTALGYGIASNNNNQVMVPMYPVYPTPYPIYPTYSSNTYYY